MTRKTLFASSMMLVSTLLPEVKLRAAGPPPNPNSWAVPSSNGIFLLVVHGDDSRRNFDPGLSANERATAQELSRRYPQSGLYVKATGVLQWHLQDPLERSTGFEQHHIRVLDDGIHVIWLAHLPFGPPRTPAHHSELASLLNPHDTAIPPGDFKSERFRQGVRLISRGVTVGEYWPDELVTDANAISNQVTAGYQPWISTVEMEQEQMVLTTLDQQRVTFDLETGEILERTSLEHQGDIRIVRWAMIAASGVVVLFSVILLIRRKPIQTPSEILSALIPEPENVTSTPPPPGLGNRRRYPRGK